MVNFSSKAIFKKSLLIFFSLSRNLIAAAQKTHNKNVIRIILENNIQWWCKWKTIDAKANKITSNFDGSKKYETNVLE